MRYGRIALKIPKGKGPGQCSGAFPSNGLPAQPLEAIKQAELNDAAARLGGCDATEVCGVDVVIRDVEANRVREVKRLGPQIDVLLFSNVEALLH